MDQTASLAQDITRQNGIFTYFIINTLVPKKLQSDCLKAYAYFRWLDDMIDEQLTEKPHRLSFIRHQQRLIDQLYKNKVSSGLESHELLIADLISNHPHRSGQLFSFIDNFCHIISFDAGRKGRFITRSQLDWYTQTLGRAVTDCIEFFISPAPAIYTLKNHYLAATAATITHMLRDQITDIAKGYCNIPQEYLREHHLKVTDVAKPHYRRWVKRRVTLARRYFHAGRSYVNHLTSRRCRLAAHLYCAKFEPILKTIEADQYLLKPAYPSLSIFTLCVKLITTLPQVLIHLPHQ